MFHENIFSNLTRIAADQILTQKVPLTITADDIIRFLMFFCESQALFSQKKRRKKQQYFGMSSAAILSGELKVKIQNICCCFFFCFFLFFLREKKI